MWFWENMPILSCVEEITAASFVVHSTLTTQNKDTDMNRQDECYHQKSWRTWVWMLWITLAGGITPNGVHPNHTGRTLRKLPLQATVYDVRHPLASSGWSFYRFLRRSTIPMDTHRVRYTIHDSRRDISSAWAWALHGTLSYITLCNTSFFI